MFPVVTWPFVGACETIFLEGRLLASKFIIMEAFNKPSEIVHIVVLLTINQVSLDEDLSNILRRNSKSCRHPATM